MSTMRSIVIVTLLALVLAAIGSAVADGNKNGQPDDKRPDGLSAHVGARMEAREDGSGKLLLHNDRIAVWFHEGKNHAKPDLRVAINGTDGNKSGYRVQILRILEIGNESGELRRVAGMNLVKSDDWNIQTTNGNDSITLSMVHAEAQGIVTLVFHIDTANDTVKFDTKIDNWRWANASDRLVLDMLVLGHNLKNETGAKISVEGAGYVTWASTATVEDANGTARTIPVDAVSKSLRQARDGGDDDRQEANREHESSDEQKEQENGNGGHVFLVFNGTGGYHSLSYDPTFGVASASTNAVPGIAPVGVVVAIAAVAVLLRRRS